MDERSNLDFVARGRGFDAARDLYFYDEYVCYSSPGCYVYLNFCIIMFTYIGGRVPMGFSSSIQVQSRVQC